MFALDYTEGMEIGSKLHDLLDEMLGPIPCFSSAVEAAEVVGQIERAIRKLDALAVAVVDAVDRSDLHRQDGHGSAQTWLAYTCRTSRADAGRRLALAAMFRKLPITAEKYRAGELGREQAATLAQACGNPRYGHLVIDSIEALLADERTLDARRFQIYLKHWISLADADGIKQRHDTAHRCRDVRMSENYDGGFSLRGSFGPIQGAVIQGLLDGCTNAERLADWEAARLIHGEQTEPIHLRRTDGQRRADALEAALTSGAAVPADAVRPEPSVHIVMSHDAFEHALAKLTGDATPKLDPRTYRTYRCETLGGTQLHPTDALAAALAGHIRRVVLGLPEASISLKGRFFTGALRDLLNVIDPTCTWAGCHIPANRCQADHTIPWRDGASTTVDNGKPLCGKHNRHKERGYQTVRDHEGRWHIHRPNGTEIQPTA